MSRISPQTETILVCFAVQAERKFFNPPSAPRVQVCITGMGRQNAIETVRWQLDATRPRFLLSCGFAGGLNPHLARNTIVFSSDEELCLEPTLLKFGAVHARFHCSTGILTTAAEKRQLSEATKADAVEMESEPIRQLCHERGIPSATIRVISDAATDDLPIDFNALLTSDYRLSYFNLACALIRTPGKIAGLLELRTRANAAASTLAQCLEGVLAAVGSGLSDTMPNV
jgi:adenosylhomocysteine nucleosidase